MPLPEVTRRSTKPPALKIKFLSHGTLECSDLQATRRFYEEVLGLECIQHAHTAMLVRLGSEHTYAVVQTPQRHEMPRLFHNGLDVGSEEEVRAAYDKLSELKAEYGIRKLYKPQHQHGEYSFFFQDLDGNWWEILVNRPRGYSWKFEDPAVDLTPKP